MPRSAFHALATAALAVVTTAAVTLAAAPAQAAPPRDTHVMMEARWLGEGLRETGKNPRSLKAIRTELGAAYPRDHRITGLVDRNRDGLDDDGKITLHLYANAATINLNRRSEDGFAVTDAGFTYRDKRAVLREAAHNVDAELLYIQRVYVQDTWAVDALRNAAAGLPAGVRLTSIYDGNGDGVDDDGRITLLSNGKAVTLTLGARKGEHGKVTYGPTWKNPAPARTTHYLPERDAEIQSVKEETVDVAGTVEGYARHYRVSPRHMGLLQWVKKNRQDEPYNLYLAGIEDVNKDGLDDDGKFLVSKYMVVYQVNLPTKAGRVTITLIRS